VVGSADEVRVVGWLSLGGCGDPAERPSPREPVPPVVHSAEDPTGTALPPLSLASVRPGIADPLGGSRLLVRGAGFSPGVAATVGGVPASVEVVSSTELRLVTGPVAGGLLDLVVTGAGGTDTLEGALEGWSPADLPGARLFDAASGVAREEARTGYEWQRLTPEIGADWRWRDGNTLSWLPATGRFWMVAGWNGYQEPDGFSSVPPDAVYPPENTTDEVWSSPDGVTWTLELPHGHGAFERRHAHNAMVWKDRLWMIGGDHHQGFYNHDVVSSADGVRWRVELGPGTTEPPWSERAGQVSGVYDAKLWTAGGQDLIGYPADQVHHNDVWSTEDGVRWTQVVPDAPASDTRWAGCGVLDGLVEFRGELWLVGCARIREDAVGHTMFAEVWSTTDGAVWRRHADPPWAGKIWHNVVVWDDKLWILFGFTYGDVANGWAPGNANEAWYSEDGETWRSLPVDAPVPGSHAQGVAVTDDFLLMAGGNYSFLGDKSAWRLVPVRGRAVGAWTDRGAGALTARALSDDARPTFVPDGLGAGIPGLWFDGSTSVLDLPTPDVQPSGRSVFWVARAPFLPAPWGWVEDYAPLGTLVGEGWPPSSSVGLSGGQVVVVNHEDRVGAYGEPIFARLAAGEGLQEGPGAVRFAGVTHAVDGAVRTFVDGAAAGPDAVASYATPRSWARLGGALDDAYYGPNTRFAGTVGAVIVLPEAADDALVAKLHAWAEGRFALE
jgi:hypothetical protein